MEWCTTRFLQQWDSSCRNEAATQLTKHFMPMLVRYGQARGLPYESAEDAAQDTIATLVEILPRYDGERGRLRDWIRGIANNKINTHLGRLYRERGRGCRLRTGFWESIPDEKATRHSWNTEIQKMKIALCLGRTRRDFKSRPKTLKAFELCFRPDMDTAAVANELGMSVDAVRVAKHRVLHHVRKLMEQFDESG